MTKHRQNLPEIRKEILIMTHNKLFAKINAIIAEKYRQDRMYDVSEAKLLLHNSFQPFNDSLSEIESNDQFIINMLDVLPILRQFFGVQIATSFDQPGFLLCKETGNSELVSKDVSVIDSFFQLNTQFSKTPPDIKFDTCETGIIKSILDIVYQNLLTTVFMHVISTLPVHTPEIKQAGLLHVITRFAEQILKDTGGGHIYAICAPLVVSSLMCCPDFGKHFKHADRSLNTNISNPFYLFHIGKLDLGLVTIDLYGSTLEISGIFMGHKMPESDVDAGAAIVLTHLPTLQQTITTDTYQRVVVPRFSAGIIKQNDLDKHFKLIDVSELFPKTVDKEVISSDN